MTVVRAATAADYSGVVALLEAASLPVAGVTPPLADFFVADGGGRIVGAIGLEFREACPASAVAMRRTLV